jgi:starch synthase
VNFLKGGIVYADMVNTVSPRYAEETRSPEYAHGLAPYLNEKEDDFLGILNGVDHETWDPTRDPYLPAHFSAADLSGKAQCKRLLQQRFLLEEAPDVPLIGVVSRFVPQKGLDLLASSIERILEGMRVQFVILGSGDKSLESFFGDLPKRYPGRVGGYIGYHEENSHWIEAGSDFFLMPSRFEPCGLNQIYSLRYGTLPLVRATGGLDDTVQQYDEASGMGTGFKFWEPSADAVYYTVGWAVSTYYDRPAHIRQMVQAAMQDDFSWEQSARAYEAVYLKARKKAMGGK